MQRLQIINGKLITSIALCAIVNLISGVALAQGPRPLAPGVLEEIPTTMDVRDSYSTPLALPGVSATAYQPNRQPVRETLHGSTQQIVMFRNIWQYEFGFMGLRQMKVRVRRGDTETFQNVWYMVYRIRNFGNSLTYEQLQTNPNLERKFQQTIYQLRRASTDGSGMGRATADAQGGVDPVAQLTGTQDLTTPPAIDRDFLPRFSLNGWVENAPGEMGRVGYRDQIHPDLVKLIQEREDPNRVLLDTVEMSRADIPLSTSPVDPGVWGVAVWTNVDPRIDFVSVSVNGLTNAYRLQVDDAGNLSRRHRTLQLNFWRPGDVADEAGDRVEFGIPLVDDPSEQAEICFRYDLPGPLMRGYLRSDEADQDILVMESDAQVNLTDFTSAYVAPLNGGQMPAGVVEAFARQGVNVPANTQVTVVVPGESWLFQDGQGSQFLLALEPQFWAKDVAGGEGIRFLKQLDHLWIYR
ncbi:MAG: hypothetical protein AAF456_19670 [Planctomycetota bacterium]